MFVNRVDIWALIVGCAHRDSDQFETHIGGNVQQVFLDGLGFTESKPFIPRYGRSDEQSMWCGDANIFSIPHHPSIQGVLLLLVHYPW